MENGSVPMSHLPVMSASIEDVIFPATVDETVCVVPEDSAVTSITRVPACENVEHIVIIKSLD